ncbi:hypothetical protein IGV49_004692 [Salmonella enterica subsp. enterica serovar Newport]|nr:hypothetical protein [Salmonella enterica subsp. enterica serovar Newport]
MNRIIEVPATKIEKIRGYMANSGQDCASGTCDSGAGGLGGGGWITSEELLNKELYEISDSFFE